MCMVLVCRYAPRFVKEFIEAAKPYISVGEYWDSCRYVGPDYALDYNQGSVSRLHLLTIIIKRTCIYLSINREDNNDAYLS